MTINLYAAWIGLLLGCLAGMLAGLFFHNEDWLGGYASWPRRMIRLGHISFFGIGFINLAFVLTSRALQMASGLRIPSYLFIVAALAMPAVCYLSAYKMTFRNLFFIPACSLTIGVALFLWKVLFP
jgi:hypothetical protein